MHEDFMDDLYNFRGILEKLEIATVQSIIRTEKESERSGRERRGAAYAPRIIMIISGLIKTLRYNASWYKRQSRGASIDLNNGNGLAELLSRSAILVGVPGPRLRE